MNAGKPPAAPAGAAALFVAALLAACAAPQPPMAPPQVNLSGYSVAFRQGYADGCDSARAGRHRDEQRFQADADYMMGWNDGYSMCRRR